GLAGGQVVQPTCDELLAGPALAGDQHGQIRLRGACDERVDLLPRAAGTDEAGRRLVRGAAGACELAPQPALLERTIDREQQLVGAERLRQVVVRTGLYQLDRRIDGTERGDDDHVQLGTSRAHLA